jgi:hypothetical protein
MNLSRAKYKSLGTSTTFCYPGLNWFAQYVS